MEQDTICIECLRCRHRGVLDTEALRSYGLRPDVSIAALSRRLVCQVCGSRAMRAFRASADDARTFLKT